MSRHPIAYFTVSNWLSVVILEIEYDIDDYIYWRWSDEVNEHQSTIEYDIDDDNRPYFLADNHRVYLDHCMRIDYK